MSENEEIYKLWWEYLRRSEPYKRYCQLKPIMEKRECDADIDPQILKEFISLEDLEPCYSANGDIHTIPFKEWYESKKTKGALLKKLSPSTILKKSLKPAKLSKTVGSIFNHIIEQFKNLHHREPTAYELKENVIAEIESLISGKIDKSNESLYEIIKPFHKPSTKKWIKELEAYLRVYDLRSGIKDVDGVLCECDKMRYREIIELMQSSPIDEDKRGDQLRIYRRYNAKAKMIIDQAEKGLFPQTIHPSKK